MNNKQMNAAKEQMINWLTHPAELGKKPSKIECAGSFELYDMTYYIFKYKKSIFGKWLLGVAGGYEGDSLENCGHTFSEMEEYNEATVVDDAVKIVEMVRQYWIDTVKKAGVISDDETEYEFIFNNHLESHETAKIIMDFLDCKCEYFPPMNDDDPVTSAYSYLSRLGVREGYIPVMVCADNNLLKILLVNTKSESDDNIFDMEKVVQYRNEYLSKKLLDYKDLFDISDDDTSGLKADTSNAESNDRLCSFWNQETRMTNPVIIAKLPVKNPWEIFAYIPFGGWNDCPDTLKLMSISKYYYDKFKAVPALISYETLEFILPEPVSKDEAVKTAVEHYSLCPTMEKYNLKIEKYIDMLSKSKIWYFWWD